MALVKKRLEKLEQEVVDTRLCNIRVAIPCKAGRYQHGDHCHSGEEIKQMGGMLIWDRAVGDDEVPAECVCEDPQRGI